MKQVRTELCLKTDWSVASLALNLQKSSESQTPCLENGLNNINLCLITEIGSGLKEIM